MKSPQIGRRRETGNFDVIPSYNVAVIGDSAVGKSAIIARLLNEEFPKEHNPTAAEVYMKTIHDQNGKRLASLQLFDTAGSFQFPAMFRLTVKKCEAFVVVYSVSSQKSLTVAKRQLQEISTMKGKHFPCVLVGNKNDVQNRDVTYECGVQAAVQHGCSYIEISASENVNVNDAFCTLIKKIDYTEAIKERLFNENGSMKMKRKRTASMKSIFSLHHNSSNSDSDSDSSH